MAFRIVLILFGSVNTFFSPASQNSIFPRAFFKIFCEKITSEQKSPGIFSSSKSVLLIKQLYSEKYVKV